MTFENAIYEVLYGLQQFELTATIGRPTIREYLNEAMQYVKRIAEESDYLFYTRSKTFSGTSVTYEASFKEMIYIYAPLATDGQVTLVSNRQYVTRNANDYAKGTTKNPIARLFDDHFEISPTTAGTYYYLWSFPMMDAEADESEDLDDFIPWAYQELVIAKTIELVLLRHFMQTGPIAQETSQNVEQMRQSWMGLYKKWQPEVAFREEQPSPVLPQQNQQNS